MGLKIRRVLSKRLFWFILFVSFVIFLCTLNMNDLNEIKKIYYNDDINYTHYSQVNVYKTHNNLTVELTSENILDSVDHLKRVHSTAQEMFNYMTVTLNKTKNLNDSYKNQILSEMSNMKNVIQLEIDLANDKLRLNDYRNSQLNSISSYIESKIYRLQNPPPSLCNSVPKLICKLTVDAGFASGIHEILWCLISAFYTNQTVILIPEWTKYFRRNGSPDVWDRLFKPLIKHSRDNWDSVFMPLSHTCNSMTLRGDQLSEIPRPNNVFIRSLMNHLPKNIGPKLIKLLDNPNSWFHSQFTGFIMRPQKRLRNYINEFKRDTNFSHPIVGVHVRRSDKLKNEALYYPLSDYMRYVNDFYDKLELTRQINQRMVYVASDDPSVIGSFKSQYPQYQFIGSESIAELASNQQTRYSNASLWGVLTDVFLLSETDYIVCTFSSAMCRLSYQLMHYNKGDASDKWKSLDVPFHYHHSLTPPMVALYNHKPIVEDQWSLKIGDEIHEPINRYQQTEWFDQAINGRGWNGYFYGSIVPHSPASNKSSYKLYPFYKMRPNITFV